MAHLQASGNAAPSFLHTVMQCALASASAFFSDVCLYEKVLHPSELLPVTRTSQYERHFVFVRITVAILAIDAFGAAAGAFAADGTTLSAGFGTFLVAAFFDADAGAFDAFDVSGTASSSSRSSFRLTGLTAFFAIIAACAACNASWTDNFL